MTVSSATSRVEYAGNGVTVAFSVPFYFLANGDLKVYVDDTLQVITTNYSVTGAGVPAGGTVTFGTAPASGSDVVIYRDPAITQTTDYTPNDPFPAESHEAALDKLTMIAQRTRDLADRSVRIPDDEAGEPDMTLPALATRASKAFYFNSAGEPTVADVSAVTVTFSPDIQLFSGDGSDTTFTLAEAPGSAAALIVAIGGVLQKPGTDFTVSGTTLTFTAAPVSGTNNIAVQNFGIARAVTTNDADGVTYTPNGSGAVNTDVQTKLREFVSVKDFGAAGDGVSDDTTDLQAAFDSGSKRVYVPAGTYLVGKLTVPSNIEIFGDGPDTTVFSLKSSVNDDVITLSSNSNVTLRGFGVDGNQANQSAGNGIRVAGGSNIRMYDIIVEDVYDHGFCLQEVTNARLANCEALSLRGGANANAVRGGFLLGASSPGITYATKVVLDGCCASGGGTYTDGFMLEQGEIISLSGCESSVPYTNFKIKTNRTKISNCHSYGGVNGFQMQAAVQSLILDGNEAHFANDSGFYFSVPSGTATDVVVSNNIAYDNGQSPSSSSYGFAFELIAGTTIDRLVLLGNTASSQGRGFSFSSTGTISRAVIANNIAHGNTADWVDSGSLEMSSATLGANTGYSSGAIKFNAATASHRLNFWADNIPATSGTVNMGDGLSGRGYIMPKAGYLRGFYVKSNAAVAAGSITIYPRKNNVNFGSGLAITSGTFNSQEETPQSNTFAAGDIITCTYNANGAFLPAGTNDFDVVVEVVYG